MGLYMYLTEPVTIGKELGITKGLWLLLLGVCKTASTLWDWPDP